MRFEKKKKKNSMHTVQNVTACESLLSKVRKEIVSYAYFISCQECIIIYVFHLMSNRITDEYALSKRNSSISCKNVYLDHDYFGQIKP